MKIDRIELFHVRMPLIQPWRTAYGEDAAIEAVLCRMSSGSCDGWGESSPLAAPCYSPEWAGGVMATARQWLAPQLIGKELASGEALQAELSQFKGNPFAKAVLDQAWWSLHAAISNQPLRVALGATREQAPVGADFGVCDSLDDLLRDVGGAVAAGFPRVKLKFRPGWDYDMVAAVRRQHPDHPLHIDCNSGYRLADVATFQRLDELKLEMFEQPLAHDDVADHAELQRQVETPVCLDESASSLQMVRSAIKLNSCRYVNIKPGRVGGLTVARQMHDLCQRAGIPCWVGGMLESATGVTQLAALAMLDNFVYPADIFPTSRFYHEDLAETPIELVSDERGTPSIRPLDLPPAPHPGRLASWTVERAVVAN
ncbi:MAG: o-succinylbenzoate synthase [Planctomycetales bacterium]|nr:o-succinylbenzoate synthase [Planctomycetales bacterium]